MTPLSDRQKQLLFDYSLGLTSEREDKEAEALIAANEEAVELYQSIQRTLSPLNTVKVEPCPDDLTQRLFSRMREAELSPAGEQPILDGFPVEERHPHPIRVPLWRNWTEVVAAAATILLLISILFPAIGRMRGHAWQTACSAQLANIYGGLRNYVSDHDGFLPSVATTPGAPWWRVGYQGQENHSNTRQIWLLPKLGYVDPSQFLCPGRPDGRKLSFDGFTVQNFSDFPSRTYILFSTRIPCPTSNGRGLTQEGVLLADRNPLSEELPSDPSADCRLRLREKVLTSNSRNHNGRGQNALMYNGSVEFARTRHTRTSDDDIYALRGMDCDSELCGCELPSCEQDIFLAP